jgi:zinc protease
MNRIGSLLMTASLLASAAAPAASISSRTDADALETLRQSNARLERFTLDNGMICLLKEDRSAPVVSIQISVGTGSIHEGDFLGAGLSHYIEHMIFKGTPTRQPGEIAKALHALGGQINAYTSLDRTVFYADLPARHWREALTILADAVMNPTFPEAECRKEKAVILRELSMGNDNPDRQLHELLWQTAYVAHPYRYPVIGFKDVFERITRDDLVASFRRRYVPDNMVTIIVGDIPAAEVQAALRQTFAGFLRRASPPVVLPTEPAQQAPRFARESGPHSLSRLTLAFHTVALPDRDAPALDLLASVAGGGQSSRLVQTIKETKKLVHGIEAWSYTPAYPGLFGVSATCDPDKEAASIAAIRAEVASWSEKPFTTAEIDKARRMMLVSELSTLQTMHGQASSYLSGELVAHNPRYGEDYLDRLQRVTPADLQDLARRYLRPENSTLVAVGPTNAVAAALAPAIIKPSDVTRLETDHAVPLVFREDHRLPFVHVCAVFRGGVLSETEATAGATRLMSDLLVRGTATRTAEAIARTAESLGAELSPFSGHNSFGLQGRCLSGDADTLVDLMADCLARASFPADELEKARTVQLATLDAQSEQPFTVAQQGLEQTLFPGHPYRWTPLGSREAVERIDRTGLERHYRQYVVGGNMVLAFFGDLTPDRARRLAEAIVRRVRTDEAPARANVTAQPKLPARVEQREPKEQCIVIFGFPGLAMTDPRRDALEVLDAAMSGMSSKVFATIREERGLAYFAGASQRMGVDPGLFMLYAGTRPDALPEVEVLLRREIDRVGREGIDAEEFARARNQLIAEHEMRLQDNGSLAMGCALDELYGLGYAYELKMRARIESVTPDAVQQVAASVLNTNRLAISIVLPAAPPTPSTP